MSERPHPFDVPLERLPGTLPIFPLPGVLLLPGGTLPLNIFEPRYLAMVDAALASGRMLGMVQPVLDDPGDDESWDDDAEDEDSWDDEAEEPEDEASAREAAAEALGIGQAGTSEPAASGAEAQSDVGSAPIYRVGCAGRIAQFAETDDGRYLITLRGLVRFRVVEELVTTDPYRRVRVDYTRHAQDLERAQAHFDRQRLLDALGYYFDQQGIEADWEAIREASNERLVTSLAMVCPFSAAEKQALLEAPSPSDRAETMTTILEMSVLGPRGGRAGPRH